MKITTEQLTEAIRKHRNSESIDPELVALGLTDSWISDLIYTHCCVEESSSGGSSDWDGGGNPHRMMEEERRSRAWAEFRAVCEELNLNPWDCRGALHNAGVR